jgi:hypothetical protein
MTAGRSITVACDTHGVRTAAVVCGHHLQATDRVLGFVENSSDPDDLQAWCDACEQFFLHEGGLTAAFERFNDRKIVCVACYEAIRLRHTQPVP